MARTTITRAQDSQHLPVSARAATETVGAAPSQRKPKLLEQMRDALRARHYSRSAEKTYIMWARRFILFHIHKAQGKTLDRVFVDLGHRAFAPGRMYVALSRVRSIQDIRLARPIRESEVRCDPNVTRSYLLQLVRMTQIREGEQAHARGRGEAAPLMLVVQLRGQE